MAKKFKRGDRVKVDANWQTEHAGQVGTIALPAGYGYEQFQVKFDDGSQEWLSPKRFELFREPNTKVFSVTIENCTRNAADLRLEIGRQGERATVKEIGS